MSASGTGIVDCSGWWVPTPTRVGTCARVYIKNIVTACWGCNNRKSGRTPDEAHMHLIRKPNKPKWHPVITITIGIRNTPESWRDYLYWNMELESDIPEP